MTMRRRSSSPNTPSSDSSPSSSDLPLAIPPIPHVDGAKDYDEAGLFRTYINDSAFDSASPVIQPMGAGYERLHSVLSSAQRLHVPPATHAVKLSALAPPNDEPLIDEPVEQEPETKAGPDVQIVHPPKENCVNLPIRVRNVPQVGAKSRVETQLKVTIDLVWDPTPRRRHSHQASSSSAGNPADSKDELAPTVGSWEWLALPPGSATKRRGRKDAKIVPTPAQTLTLHTMVNVASPPHTAARACKKCLGREAKRAERKRRVPNDPTPEIPDLSSVGCEDDKIVLYNCADVLDFKSGSVDLPVRLTCYCRHHSEKVGFCITFILRDQMGRTVGTGVTPPIMITDDHKSTARKVQAQQSIPGAGLVPPTQAVSGSGLVPTSASSNANGGPRKGSKEKNNGGKHRMKPYERSTGTSRASSLGVKEELAGALSFGATSYATPSTQGFASPPPQSPTLFSGMFGMQGALLGDTGGMMDGTGMMGDGMLPPASATLLSPTRSAFLSPPRSPINSRTHTRAHSPVQMMPSTPSHIPSPAHTTLRSPVDSRAHSPARGILSPSLGAHALPGGGLLMDPFLGGDAALLGLDNDALMSSAFPDGQMFDPSFDPTSVGALEPSSADWDAMLQSLSGPQVQAPSSTSSGAMYVEHPAGTFSPAAWDHPTNLTASWAPEAMDLSPPETAPVPRISRVVPNSGPIQGGIEVTLLGENFTQAYECKFGEYVATETALWGGNTLVCLLPPAAQPGAVPVRIKGYENAKRPGERDVLFTYRDDTIDRSLMELALRVVGQRMTGRQEEPCNIARRIVAVGEMQPNSNTNGLATRLAQSIIESDSSRPEESGPSRQDELIQFLTLLDVPNVGSRGVPTRAAVSLQNETGHTLLHLCAVLGFDELAKDLLSRGADPDVRDATGQTALHLAALRGQMACTRVLLEGDADTEIVNAYGMAPIDVARERGTLEVVALLEGVDQDESTEEESDTLEGVEVHAPDADDSIGADADESDLDAEDGELRSRVLGESEDDIISSGSEDAIDALYGERASRPSLDSITDTRPPFLGEIPKVPSTWFHRTFSHLQPQKAWPLPQIYLPDMPTLPAWPVTIPWPQTPDKGAFDLGAFRGFLGNKQQQAPANPGLTVYPPPPQPGAENGMQGLNPAQLRTRLARRLGYYPTQVTDREIRAYTHHSQKMRKLKKDRMLVLFWLPILLMVIAWGLYQSVPVAVNVVVNKVRDMLPLAN